MDLLIHSSMDSTKFLKESFWNKLSCPFHTSVRLALHGCHLVQRGTAASIHQHWLISGAQRWRRLQSLSVMLTWLWCHFKDLYLGHYFCRVIYRNRFIGPLGSRPGTAYVSCSPHKRGDSQVKSSTINWGVESWAWTLKVSTGPVVLTPPITEDRGEGVPAALKALNLLLWKEQWSPLVFPADLTRLRGTGWVKQGLSGRQELRVAPVSLEAGEWVGTHPATSSSSNTMLETFIHAVLSKAVSSLPYLHSQQHITFRTLSQGQPFWRMASGKEVIPSSPASQLYFPHFSSKQHVLRYPKLSPRINTSIYLRSRTIWKSGGQMSYSLRAEDSFPPCPTTPRELTELPAGRKQAAPLRWELSTHRAQHHSSRRACLGCHSQVGCSTFHSLVISLEQIP